MSSTAYTNNNFISDDGKTGKELNEKSVKISIKSVNGAQTSENYDPYEHRRVSHPLTNTETLVHLLKVAIGTGIFAMPNAFNHAGYIVGTIGTISLGLLATYCVQILVNLHYELCKWKKVPSMNYPLIVEAALLSGPRSLRRFAPVALHVLNAFMLIFLVGSTCICFVFIATNLRALLVAFGIELDVRLVMVIILVPSILINSIRQLKYLAPLSSLGNLIMIGSVAIIFYYIFREPLTLEGKRPYATLSEFPMFFSTVLFALEAIGVIMPLENAMKTPGDFCGTTGILNRAMFVVVTLYTAVGLFGYLKYGANIQATITVNLPQDDILAQASKLTLVIGVIAQYAINCYAAVDIIWTQYYYKWVEKSNRQLFFEYLIRISVVLCTFALSVAIPNLDLFISFIGALSLSMLGIIFPPFLESVYIWDRTSGRKKLFKVVKNGLICVIGIAGLIFGTTLSVKDIIKTYTV